MHRRTISISAALSLLLALCFMLPTPGAAGERKYVFMDEPLAPYVYGEEGGLCQKGLTKEILDELFRRLGLAYEIRLVPWARAMDSVKNGDCDAVPMLIKTPEREIFLQFTAPIVENRELLYYLPERLGDFQWKEPADLKELHIGLVRGYTYNAAFLNAVEEHAIRVSYGKDSHMILNLLEAGRVDAIVEDETVARPLLAAHPEWAGRTAVAKKPISSYYWHIGIYRNSPLARRIDAINHALDTMRTDGTLKKILDKRWNRDEAP